MADDLFAGSFACGPLTHTRGQAPSTPYKYVQAVGETLPSAVCCEFRLALNPGPVMVVVRESIFHTLTKLKQASSAERRVIVEKERGLTVTMSLRAENWYFSFLSNRIGWNEKRERMVNSRTAGVFHHCWGAKAQKCETAIPHRGPLTAAFQCVHDLVHSSNTQLALLFLFCNATIDTTLYTHSLPLSPLSYSSYP